MLHVAPNINIGFTMSPKATTEIFQTDSRIEPITLYIRIQWDPIISYGMKKNQKNLACIIDKIWRSTERLFSPRFLWATVWAQRALSSMCVSSMAMLIFSVSPQSTWSLPHAWVRWSKFDTPPWLCIFSRCEAISPVLASYKAICAFINLGSRKSGHEVN
jgi:hypothetical protein